MLKIVPPGSFDFGEEAVSLIRSASRGLRGDDRRALVKRASPELAAAFDKLALHPGEVPVHLIALGNAEIMGANRNADAFPDASCARDHHTFVKYAKWFHDHRNGPKDDSWGRVAHSHYNRPMARIELIVALNGTKEAAERNGGLVAEDELEKLARGEEIPVSMATSIPSDFCSGCRNEARVKSEYCDERRCPTYGGLRKNAGRTYADGHTLHMINHTNKWKDISRVRRPADRIAYTMGRLDKAAAAAAFRTGADLADDLGLVDAVVPELYAGPRLLAQAKAAAAMAEACARPPAAALLLAFAPAAADIAAGRDKAAALLSASIAAAAPLGLADFLALATGDPAAAKAAALEVAPFVPGTYAELAAAGEAALAASPYAALPAPGLKEAAEAAPALSRSSLARADVARRAAAASLRGGSSNVGHFRGPGRGPTRAAAAIARQYALYKVAALAAAAGDPDWRGLAEAAAAQDLAAALLAAGGRFEQPAARG